MTLIQPKVVEASPSSWGAELLLLVQALSAFWPSHFKGKAKPFTSGSSTATVPPLHTLAVKSGGEYFHLTTSFRISCQSDKYDAGVDMAGIVIYQKNGKRTFPLPHGATGYPGYIYLRKSDDVSHIKSEWGEIHGSLYKSLFPGEEPDDVLATGFSIRNGQWGWYSRTFNSARKPAYQNNEALASPVEQCLIKSAVTKWSATSGQSKTFYVSDLGCGHI